MSGTLIHFLNGGLASAHDIVILMSHCCGGDIIPTHSRKVREEGILKSHELNKFRGDKIRGLVQPETVLVGWDIFSIHIPAFAKDVYHRYQSPQLVAAA
jgi:hypothetical protein